MLYIPCCLFTSWELSHILQCELFVNFMMSLLRVILQNENVRILFKCLALFNKQVSSFYPFIATTMYFVC